MSRAAVIGIALLLVGCGMNEPKTLAPVVLYKCANNGLNAFIGRKADAALGAEMQRVSGARLLRWAPPRSAVTMDYREDRLTVGYDDAMMVTSAKCG